MSPAVAAHNDHVEGALNRIFGGGLRIHALHPRAMAVIECSNASLCGAG
jgi:hypothetical protein